MTQHDSPGRRAVLAGGAAGVLAPRLSRAQDGAALSVRIDRDVQNLDPPFRTGQVDGNVIRAVFQRLVSYRPGEYVRELDAAERIEQASPTEIAFTLKRGQMFTDGYGEMTADDVKFSFERYLRPEADGRISSYRDDWANLLEVRVHDTYSGSLVFSKPSPAVWNVALVGGAGAIHSRKALAALGIRHAQSPVGSGAYRLTAYNPGRGVTLVANPGYAGGPPAHIPTVNLRYIANPRTAELALQSRELDFTELSISAANTLARTRGVVVRKRPGQRFVWLGMNMERAPLDNPAVRQAIRAALDVDQMVAAGYRGDAVRLNAMIPPGLVGHWPEAPVYQRDAARARALLAASGVALPLALKVTILNEPAFQNMALVAQALLREVGINLEVDQREGGAYWSSGRGESGRLLELFFLRFNAHVDPNFNARWFVPDQIGEWNWGRWNSPNFARLQAESLVNVDAEGRGRQVVEMQRLMDASASMVWLTNEVVAFGHRAGLEPAVMPNGNDWQLNHFKVS